MGRTLLKFCALPLLVLTEITMLQIYLEYILYHLNIFFFFLVIFILILDVCVQEMERE